MSTADAETFVVNHLRAVGHDRQHWWLNPRMLSEIEYMIETLKILVEPDWVPLNRPTDSASDVGSEDAGQYIPAEVKIAVWRRDGGRCAQCGSVDRLGYDHLLPPAKGGTSTERNIQLLCDKCRRRKTVDVR